MANLEELISSVSVATQELYTSILDDAAVYENCGEEVPDLLRDVPELRMDVKFILVDLQTIIRACFATEKFYEKRYHLKNLYAGMLEGYKLLYGFGNMRKRTIWARIGDDLQRTIDENSAHQSLYRELKTNYDTITQKLVSIESTKTDRDDRNLTYHYDDDLLLVYRLTLKTDSEEKASLKYMEFMKILGSMLELVNRIEIVEALQRKVLPERSGHHDDIALMIVKNVAETLGNHPKMPEVLSEAIDRGANQLDSYARYKQDVIKVEEYVGKNNKIKTDIPEFSIMKDLLDVQMMVSFMMADMAAILRGFVGAGSKVEYPLTLRRLTISRVSTLNHLIGYRKDDLDSMWSGIMAVIPPEEALIDEALAIKNELKSMRKPGDLDKRALYVHLIDNHKYHSNIPEIVKVMEDVAILLELQTSQDIIKLCGRISRCLAKLMNVLSENARKAREESDRKLKRRMDDIRQLANHPNCPPIFRDSIRKQMDELERIVVMS